MYLFRSLYSNEHNKTPVIHYPSLYLPCWWQGSFVSSLLCLQMFFVKQTLIHTELSVVVAILGDRYQKQLLNEGCPLLISLNVNALLSFSSIASITACVYYDNLIQKEKTDNFFSKFSCEEYRPNKKCVKTYSAYFLRQLINPLHIQIYFLSFISIANA